MNEYPLLPCAAVGGSFFIFFLSILYYIILFFSFLFYMFGIAISIKTDFSFIYMSFAT